MTDPVKNLIKSLLAYGVQRDLDPDYQLALNATEEYTRVMRCPVSELASENSITFDKSL
jgi:hypothetical protein